MKLSNKLLLLFFISIPVSLFAYNWLLREQFLAGNIKEVKYEMWNSSDYVQTKLPEIRHLVIDGAFNSGDPDFPGGAVSVNWKPNIQIDYNKRRKNNDLQIDKLFKDMAHTRIKGDTLFVSFYRKERIKNNDNFYSRQFFLKVRLNNLMSVKGASGNFNINGPFDNKDSVRFSVTSGSLTINNIKANEVQVTADSGAYVNVPGNNIIGKLSYSLLNKSELRINDLGTNISSMKAVRLDSLAGISISGNAKDMKQYLQAATKQ